MKTIIILLLLLCITLIGYYYLQYDCANDPECFETKNEAGVFGDCERGVEKALIHSRSNNRHYFVRCYHVCEEECQPTMFDSKYICMRECYDSLSPNE